MSPQDFAGFTPEGLEQFARILRNAGVRPKPKAKREPRPWTTPTQTPVIVKTSDGLVQRVG